jgi:hypothetical protein
MYLFWVLIWSHAITIMTLERLYESAATCSTSNTTPLHSATTMTTIMTTNVSVVLTPLTLVNKGQVNPESVFRTGQSMASMRVNVTGSLQLHGLEKLVILLELTEITLYIIWRRVYAF